MKLKYGGVAVVVLVGVVGVALYMSQRQDGASPDATTTKTTPIKVGFIGPLTGDAAFMGEPMRWATELAEEEINAQGGIGGRTLEILYEDGMCSAKEAATAAQKLIEVDGVDYILGGLCSGETLGAAPVTEKAQIILFSPGSGSPEITHAGDFVFRNYPSDASSGSKVAEIAVARGFLKVAILSEQTDYAQAVKKVFENKFLGLGGVVVADESYSSDTTDLRSLLTKMKAAKPDALYFVPQGLPLSEVMLRQFEELGLAGTVQLLSNEVIVAGDILTRFPAAVEGAIFAEPAFNDQTQAAQDFAARFTEAHGTSSVPLFYLASAYDAVFILKETIETYGDSPTAVRDGLYKIQNRAGVAGTLTIDPQGDALLEYAAKEVKGGKVTVLETE